MLHIKILEMIVLCFSMQGEDRRMLMARVMCLDLCMQEEGILDYTNVKRILCTL
jgi:hypothetical protein